MPNTTADQSIRRAASLCSILPVSCSAQVFVAVLGASSYTYAEATWSPSLPDWIGSHVRAFTFYGGLPEIVVVPDNLKSAVKNKDIH